MPRYVTAGVLGLMLLTGATSALAEVHILTLEGTIDSGSDGDNQFGLSGGSLAGHHYIEKYVYDSSLGDHFTSASYDLLMRNGGTGISPITSASMTINGITREIGAADNALIYFGVLGSSTGISVTAEQSLFGPTAQISGSLLGQIYFGAVSPFSLTTDFSGAVAGSGDVGLANSFHIRTDPYGGTPSETFGSLIPNSVRIGSPETAGGQGNGNGPGGGPSGVPEPASWAMMIAGFGLTGAAMRRRRRSPISIA